MSGARKDLEKALESCLDDDYTYTDIFSEEEKSRKVDEMMHHQASDSIKRWSAYILEAGILAWAVTKYS